MRFLVDECTGPTVARWLEDGGHDVFDVYERARGSDDLTLQDIALEKRMVIITNDKGFAESLFREGRVHHGVIFLRLRDERPETKIMVLDRVLKRYGDSISRNFMIITEKKVRVVVPEK